MKMTEQSILEFIVRSHSQADLGRAHAAGLQIGIGDDAAVWRPRPGQETTLTCDWFLDGTHFLADRHPPRSVGWKCLARAVSDVAAMGADPRCFLLNLALPGNRAKEWLAGFLKGLRAASRAFRCPIAGGDTTQRDQVLINVTVIGECHRGREILRSGARPGDAIYVTGRLGEAEYGLQLIQTSGNRLAARDSRLQKQLFPIPRLEVGAFLARRRLASAMMDLSDGLSSDLPRLCAASGTGAHLDLKRIPRVSIAKSDVHRGFDASQLALHGGDDYELLFTVAKKNVVRIPSAIGRIAITQIGEITSQRKILLSNERVNTHPLENKGWDPFR
jgi:thiamine-monophosphate kinase